jgi:hypothetical protein
MSEPQAPLEEPRGTPPWFWLVVIAGVISLGGGATLLYLSQTGGLGLNAGTGPGLPSETYVARQQVDIWKNDSWHPGAVVAVEGSRYRVRFDRAEVFPDEVVDATRLQPHEQ